MRRRRRRRVLAAAVLAAAGCSSSDPEDEIRAATRAWVVEQDAEYGALADGFAADDVEVVEVLVDGDCAGVHVIEPDHDGWSGEMTAYLRRTDREWTVTDYVTGHGADRLLDEQIPNCWREEP